ncbi:MAG: hypothetical protein IJX92_02240 [Clostridia bacterium]|nr:hypothetical protein [Clostridia bacterium]
MGLFQYLLILATVKRRQTLKETIDLRGIKLVFVEIYRIVMKGVTIIYDFFLAFFGIIALSRGETISALILIYGAILMYILVLKDYSEENIIRYFAKKIGLSVNILQKIILVYYPCVLILQTAVLTLALIIK